MIEAARAGELRRLAVAALRARKFDQARKHLHSLVKLTPGDPAAWRNLGGACRDLGRWPEAVTALRRAAQLAPHEASVAFALAACLAGVGRLGEAERLLRRLSAAPADRLAALARLGALRPPALTPEEIQEMVRAAETGLAGDEACIALWFAAGAALEARGDYGSAFSAYDRGARAQAEHFVSLGESVQALLAEHARSALHVEAVSASGLPIAVNASAHSGLKPIFIVGMPRSGSSLVEQILASHPDVEGMGETGLLPALLERAYPAAPGGAFSPPLPDLADVYLAGLRARGWDGRKRFVDKTLENYLHVGAIAAMFPAAVFIEVRRDPRDTIVACWRTHLARPSPTLCDFADIAAEAAIVDGLMRHWQALLPAAVHRLDLESLIADPQNVIPQLVKDRCGLTWTPACLRPWRSQTVVRSASAAQVRSPFTTESVQRWRRFHTRLPQWLAELTPERLRALRPPA